VPHGERLGVFVDAVLTGDEAARTISRRDLRQALGDAGFVDACATVASFNAVVKIADGTGIPLEDYKAAATAELRQQLDLESFRT
jgi:uncharacterized protein (DUF1697 family)